MGSEGPVQQCRLPTPRPSPNAQKHPCLGTPHAHSDSKTPRPWPTSESRSRRRMLKVVRKDLRWGVKPPNRLLKSWPWASTGNSAEPWSGQRPVLGLRNGPPHVRGKVKGGAFSRRCKRTCSCLKSQFPIQAIAEIVASGTRRDLAHCSAGCPAEQIS